MNKDGKEYRLEIIEMIKEMPVREQSAIIWTIKNFKFVKNMCENPEMTEDEIQRFKKDAIAKEDYLMLSLLCAAETFKNSGSETEKQEN